MNRILTSLTVCLAASSLIVASAAKTSQAAIVTFRDGQDLVIEFERSIEFIATERYEDTVYGIVLKDVYSQNNITTIVSDQNAGGAAISFGTPPETQQSTGFGVWGHSDVQFGALDERSLFGEFVFAEAQLAKVGSRATLTAGNVRMLGFFDNPGAVAPDRRATGVVLTDRLSRPISSITAVPEPSSLGCVAVCLMGLMRRRR